MPAVVHEVLKTWFSLSRPVGQRFYAASGFGLVAFRPNVGGVAELPPPSELVFWLGIAHPLRARIRGSGVGAIRTCEFSTGSFVEPITAWDPPRRLAFDVRSEPPPLAEWSPYQHVYAPHLVGGRETERREFRLIPLAADRTRLEGSTWYRNNLFPQLYWNLWSDALIHRIHRRVLEHVKRRSEGRGAGPSSPDRAP